MYTKYQEAYHWLPSEIDKQDILFLIEQLAVTERIKQYKNVDYVLNHALKM